MSESVLEFFKDICVHHHIISLSFFADFVQQRLDDPCAGDDTSVLDHILDAEGVDVRDKITMIIDLVSAGVDTVS